MSSDNDILTRHFDCVVMLTWSDWKTEPRSNRYHYATRFAKYLPVIFVQPDLDEEKVTFEQTGIERLEILHVYKKYGRIQNKLINRALLGRRYIQPLLWIYNPYFVDFVTHRYAPLKIYHATENYFISSDLFSFDNIFYDKLKRLLAGVDLLVAVSEGVLNSFMGLGGYIGQSIVLPNGCDFAFWKPGIDETQKIISAPPASQKIILYQGGVNNRLDWELIRNIALSLLQWEVWICGAVDPLVSNRLKSLLAVSNIRYFGFLEPGRVRELSYSATVGIIPFIQDELMRTSLPLKAFEYVACGLPVVSTPIDSLIRYKDIFEIARTAEEFTTAIERVAQTRSDESMLQKRLSLAESQDYDQRFCEIVQKIDVQIRQRKPVQSPLNILILYDAYATRVSTIHEHLLSFSLFARSNIFYAAATNSVECPIDLEGFDVVLFNYSVRLCYDWHFSPSFADAVRDFGGYKAMFIQDEYDTPETTRKWMTSLGMHAVFTCVPAEYVDMVYPSTRFPRLECKRVLTGYIPLNIIEVDQKPIADRKIAIGYRGRPLPYYYGDLGREKIIIAEKMREICEERGIPVDIEWTEEKRIYGDRWYMFVGSSKATLGTESGSNVFDDYGDIKENIEKALIRNPSLSYEDAHAQFIGEKEGQIKMNQISPRIFEAIAFKTALILFEGTYSGVIQPHLHFIPLKKDFSNIDDVLKKLGDDDYLEQLTDRAYRDIIESGKYSYETFVREIEEFLFTQVPCRSDINWITGIIGLHSPARDSAELIRWLQVSSAPATLPTSQPLGPEESTLFSSSLGLFSDALRRQERDSKNYLAASLAKFRKRFSGVFHLMVLNLQRVVSASLYNIFRTIYRVLRNITKI